MPRCTAKSKRSQNQCLKWAMFGKNTCHMHGGKSKGPLTKEGKDNSRKAAFRHGAYTKQSLALYNEAISLIRKIKNLLSNT